MAGLLWLAAAIALGCLFLLRFGGLASLPGPRWARALAVFGFGAPMGMGLASSLFWLGRAALPAIPLLPMLLELALLAWLAWEAYRRRGAAGPPVPKPPAFPWNPVLAAALAAAAGISAAAMTGVWDALPHGNWDAWAIWNVRARFLAAGGELARRAWSDAITHPNYPQLLPGLVARCWAYGGAVAVSAPIGAGFLFWAALVSCVTGGVALLRGPALGLLSGLALVGAPFFLREAPAQYADVPLACYMAGALLLLLLGRPSLAGALAGFAAWTKDEGLLFLAVFVTAAALFRRGWLRAAAGALPAAALVLAFKFAIASGTSSTLARSVPTLTQHLTDPGRYETVLSGSALMLQAMRYGWHHPFMALLALAVLLRFDFKEKNRDLPLSATVLGGMLAGYFLMYVISPYDLGWHIEGSAMRLAAQVWPILVLAVFTGLSAPESAAVLPAPKRTGRKARGRA